MTGWMLLALALSASQASPLPDDPGEAFRAGKVKYDVGEFDDALALFRRAYELKPAPLLLFNMGQCHRQLGNHERAIFFFDGFLREAPEKADRSLVEELIAEETRLLNEEKDKVVEDPVETPPDKTPPKEIVVVQKPPKEEVTPPPEEESSVVLWSAVGAATVAVVGAAVVTAVVLANGEPPASLGSLEF